MRHARPNLLLVLGSILVFGSALAVADEDEIYVCEDDHGNPVFQTDPCPEELKPKAAARVPERTLESPPTAAASKPAAATRPSPPAQRGRPSWTRLSRAPRAPSAERSTLGKQSFPTQVAGTQRAAEHGFGSPEQTWRVFLASVHSGDRQGAVACLTPAARERLGDDIESFPLERLRRLLDSFTQIRDEGALGPFWSISGLRERRRPKWIFFEKTRAGEWKIAGI